MTIDIDETFLEAEDLMDKAIDAAKEDFAGIRTGRVNAGMFSKILVDYYGAPTPLQQLASFQAPEARMMLIAPFDVSALAEIERAVRDSDLGVNPSNDGKQIRVVLPALTQERRQEYIRLAHAKGEQAKVSVRHARRKAKEDIEKAVKDGGIGEDDGHRFEKDLEDLTKKYVDHIDELMETKEQELLEF